jgi:hypothetical protein
MRRRGNAALEDGMEIGYAGAVARMARSGGDGMQKDMAVVLRCRKERYRSIDGIYGG